MAALIAPERTTKEFRGFCVGAGMGTGRGVGAGSGNGISWTIGASGKLGESATTTDGVGPSVIGLFVGASPGAEKKLLGEQSPT